MFHVPEKFRVRQGRMSSTEENGNNGAFVVPLNFGQRVNVIASDGEGWEHVSVSRTDRVPTWDEMCQVKDIFWDDNDTVVQYHPAKCNYVNNHPNCLHLWRFAGAEFPTPPIWMV